jgi:hypothetical protein
MTPRPDPPSSGPGRFDDSGRESRNLHELVWELERRVDRQAVLIRALFAVLEAQGVGAPALEEAVARIEQDRAAGAPRPCVRCGRAMGRRQMTCVYCGQAREFESPFDLL